MVVLAEVFRLLPNPNAKQRSALKVWFWRTAVTGYFGGWNTGNMSADQQAAAKFAAGQSADLEVLLNDTGSGFGRRSSFASTPLTPKF